MPSWRVTPETRCIACAASESGLRAICSALTAFTTPTAVRCSSSARLTLPRSARAVTVISPSCSRAAAIVTSSVAVPPALTATPVTVLAA